MDSSNNIEGEEWYEDVSGDFLSTLEQGNSKRKGRKKDLIMQKNLFDLDCEDTVKLISQKPAAKSTATNSGYGGSPGAPTFQVGKDIKQKEEGDVVTVEIYSNDKEGADAATKAPGPFDHISHKKLRKLATMCMRT